ncbi:interleukin-18-binding protein [Macrotis lagotis]|uniref:interleukin-18-binding protein n=1 Tax=Macrotis lagotis TaxID=92651 RepID=UPI003D68DFBC
MGGGKPAAGGPEVRTGSLLFSAALTLALGWALAQDSVPPCPEELDVTVTESEPPTSGPLTLSCRGCSRFSHSSFLYWLGNRSFIERLAGRLREGGTRRRHLDGATWLRRDLVLEAPSPALRGTNFSCVLVDPARVSQHHVLLARLWESDGTPPTRGRGAPPTTSRPREASRASNQA